MNCIIGKLPHEGFNIGSIIVVPHPSATPLGASQIPMQPPRGIKMGENGCSATNMQSLTG